MAPHAGSGGCQLALRPSASPRPPRGTRDRRGGWRRGGGGGGQVRRRRETASGCAGGPTPASAGYSREGVTATCGSSREFASAADDGCGGGSGIWGGGSRTSRRGRCWSRAACVSGRGFRVAGVARREPGWPALAQGLAELARAALWLASRLRVELLKLLGSCTVLVERVFAAAEDWGGGRDGYAFFGGPGGYDRGRL